MLNETLAQISVNLQNIGYIVQANPSVPGVKSLLYAHSPAASRRGFAKVEDHFLFVDWEYAVYSRTDLLQEAYKKFSAFVNQGFHVPHALRLRIPNLALIAVSLVEFPAGTASFPCNTIPTPWYGGETGQYILYEVKRKKIFSRTSPRYREPGSLPIFCALDVIRKILPQ